ncbi:DUF3530 family protein [Reinekea marina]|uniref:DUF3530 family protein n=1 Tax=Reinekea marina TaxID=1310421 RepID=A0ABV7WQH7_9GAMM|nr:DUF3530 family protein [Reinekea marina]MDN3648229.1 DUF3530 family protein [Reinekea marina]
MNNLQQFFCGSVLFLLLNAMQLGMAQGIIPTPKLLKAQDLATYYERALKGEQVVLLENELEKFYALTLEQETADPKGGLLILHDKGQTADWPFLLQQTRQFMPSVGWTTLSLDLPTPQGEALGRLAVNENANAEAPPETDEQWQARVLERIATGIRQLNNEGLLNIAILGYGDGGYWASRYLAERLSEEEETGYALILVDVVTHPDDVPSNLSQLDIPVLDLYMANSEFAHRQAQQRLAAVNRAKLTNFTQIHDALRQQSYGAAPIDRSTRRIWGWLRNNASGGEVNAVEKPTP